MNKKSTLYKINSKIGFGGQGIVFGGIRTEDSLPVAIKKIKCEDFDDVNSNLEEVLQLKNLKHPNIIEYIDIFFETLNEVTYMCLIMPYFSNGDLNIYLKKNKPEEKEIINFLKQIANSLKFLNEKKIIHRDLKPVKNILKKIFNIKGNIIF